MLNCLDLDKEKKQVIVKTLNRFNDNMWEKGDNVQTVEIGLEYEIVLKPIAILPAQRPWRLSQKEEQKVREVLNDLICWIVF